ncbi:MAG TPA: hypothetical protein VFN96_09415 [Gemmatimonadales bacterium]|nr:hypothetical protein [Gemmatimonadales bacterium]
MSPPRITVAVLGVAVLASACRDSSPTSPDPLAPSLQASQSGQAPTLDQLDRAVPGFGGFFLDAAGRPTVYLLPGGDRGAAGRALAGFLRQQGRTDADLQVLPGRYTYAQLNRWFNAATPAALGVAGAVFADLDEAANRLRIGVEDLSAMAGVRGELGRLGIPAEAVIVEATAPIVQMLGLRDVVRPVVGGVQINFPGFLCTLGFNAQDGTQNSFITNSHCTSTQGGVESTPYWQPLQTTAPTQIATEVEDPAYQRRVAGCPNGRRCRYSDASRALYAGGITFTLGGIAQTTGPNNGSLTIAGQFTITAEDPASQGNGTGGSLPVGTIVNKVGRTTGWTQGRISNTCVTTGVSGTNIVQICQNFVQAGVNSGDSGSPVYQITSGTSVKLAGILWGGSGTTLFVYSPIANIEKEIGQLRTF